MNVVLRFDRREVDRLRAVLKESDFRFEERQGALFLAKRPGVTATAYASGKLLLTGRQAPEYAHYLEHGSHGLALRAAEERREPPFRPRAGTDEAGKGDFFGPLVVAAVAVPNETTEKTLREKRVRDSKAMGEDEILRLASWLSTRVPNRIVVVSPRRYNEMYPEIGNLNDLLAWGHARALEDLLAEVDVPTAVVDKFANEAVLNRHLLQRGRGLNVEQAVGAESLDRAVAAASVLARAEFVRRLRALSVQWGVDLPKGGGAPTLPAGRAFVAKHGADALKEVAKLHFRNTRQVLG